MFQCESILFPVEFSRRDETAATFVLSIAQRYGARVVLLHVLQPPPPAYGGMGAVYPESLTASIRSPCRRMDTVRFGARCWVR